MGPRMISAMAVTAGAWAGFISESGEPPSFRADIAPVLMEKCVTCHGPEKQSGGYRVDTYLRLLRPGDSGESPVVAGRPGDSLLWRLLNTTDPDDRMPQRSAPLEPRILDQVRLWITEGAMAADPDRERSLSEFVDLGGFAAAPEAYVFPMPLRAIAPLPGDTWAVGGYREILIWNGAGELARRIPGLPDRIHGLAPDPEGERMFFVGGVPGRSGVGGWVHWAAEAEEDPKPVVVLQDGDEVLAMALSQDGGCVAMGGTRGEVRLFGVGTLPHETRRLTGHADWILDVSFSPDGERLATASRDRTARVFEVESGRMMAAFRGHEAPVTAVGFSADGRRVFTGGRDGRIRCWDAASGGDARSSKPVDGEVTRLLVAEGRVFSAWTDGMVREHRSDNLKLNRDYGPPGDRVLGLGWRPGTPARLAGATHDGRLRFWETETGEEGRGFLAVPISSKADAR